VSDLNFELRIIERRTESADCLSLLFARHPEVVYSPGDWMDIRFPTPEFPVGRTYSFASSPTEPDLRITFKRGMTPFKLRLAEAEPSETMLITQYGSNGFLLDPSRPAVFIAGGVGITPFRSMLKSLVDTSSCLPVHLIYQNRRPDFPFRAELDQWVAEHRWLSVHYQTTETMGRLTCAELSRLVRSTAPERKFYVAGPPPMVDAIVAHLVQLETDGESILTDAFTGYEDEPNWYA